MRAPLVVGFGPKSLLSLSPARVALTSTALVLAVSGCDLLKRGDADAGAIATPAPPVTATATTAVAPVVPPTPTAVATLTPTPGTKPATPAGPRLDGGPVAAVGDGGAVAPAAPTLAIPTGLPTAFPTALPSGFPTAVPSGFPTALPPGFPQFPIPGQDAGKK